MTLATNIPFRNAPMVDPNTGQPTEAWYIFLAQLFNRLGGTATPQYNLNQLQAQTDYNGFDFSQTDPVAAQAERQIVELQTQVDSSPPVNISQLENRIERLQEYVYSLNHTDDSAIIENIAELENYLMAQPLPTPVPAINYTNVTTFLNGWNNLGGAWAPARYMKDVNSIVRLSGVVSGGTAGATIFQLPPGYRPQYQDIFPATVSTGSTTYVIIDTSGNVTPNGSGTSSLSFSGITFKAI